MGAWRGEASQMGARNRAEALRAARNEAGSERPSRRSDVSAR